MKEKSWDDFRASGVFWFMNTFLHMFGWTVVVEVEDGKVLRAFPARVQFRGFDEKSNDEGYAKVSNFLRDNIEELHKEATS